MSFRTIIFGTAMLSSVRMLRLMIQFIAIPILARLLSPEDYGLIAIAMPFCLFAMMLADAGIGTSLVRTPMDDRRAWSTCFWLTIILGAVLGLFLAAIGPLMADLFEHDVLAPMIAALGFVVFAQAIHLIPVAALQQVNRFRAIAGIELAAALFSTAVTLYMAYHGYGAWALVGQQLSFFAVRVVTVCIMSPFRPTWLFDWPYVRDHIRFGRNVLGTMIVNYFGRSFDNLVVGKALGAGPVGIYSMAFQFARLPSLTVAGPLQYVIYASLIKIKDDKAAVGQVFLVMTRLLAIIIFPPMGLVAIAHEPIFAVLLSPKWAEVGLIFVIITPATALQAVTGIGESVCYSLNRTELQFRSVAQFSILWIGALIGAVSFGLTSAAITFTVCVLLYQMIYIKRITNLIDARLSTYFSTYTLPLTATIVGMAIYAVVLHYTQLSNGWFKIGLAAVLCIIAMGTCFLLQRKKIIQDMRQLNFKGNGKPMVDSETMPEAI